MQTSMRVNPSPSQHHQSPRARRGTLRRGYLLLEACLALAITAIVLTAVFQIAQWNIQVSQSSITSANEHIHESALFSFLDRAFTELSGDAQLALEYSETPDFFLSKMTIQNSGHSFSWPNQGFNYQAVKLVTHQNASGSLDIILEYYLYPLLQSPFITGQQDIQPDQEPLTRMKLLENVLRFEWRVWDGNSYDQDSNPLWIYDWHNPGQTPRYLELSVVFTDGQQPIVHTFWNPAKVNPLSHFRSLQQAPPPTASNAPTTAGETSTTQPR